MVQWFNWPGIKLFFKVIAKPELARPSLHVKSINKVHWDTLIKESNIRAVVLDKDNTFAAPYGLKVHSSLENAMEKMIDVFSLNNIAVLSNSAGTLDDIEYKEAKIVEENTKLKVIIHNEKKPGGGSIDVLNHFEQEFNAKKKKKNKINDDNNNETLKCEEIAMVGDRILTDVVYGNVNNMYTILVDPITEENDDKVAKMMRRLERKMFL